MCYIANKTHICGSTLVFSFSGTTAGHGRFYEKPMTIDYRHIFPFLLSVDIFLSRDAFECSTFKLMLHVARWQT